MKMPNGHITDATISGTVILSNFITLNNVYYIPSFTTNLIFVTQLASDSSCFLNFYIDKCLILQNLSQQTVGLAKCYGDLYVFHAQSLSCNIFPTSCHNYVTSLDNNATLWHQRLGHISDFVHKIK